MGVYVGTDTWVDEIYQFEETDVVQGGPEGIDNVPLVNLADRTVYLYNRIGQIKNLSGESVVVANTTINNTYAGKLITARAGTSTALNLNLDSAANFPDYAVIHISSYCGFQGVVNVVAPAGQYFYDSDGNRTRMYMHHKESLTLVACINHFKVVNPSGNFFCAGEEVKGRKAIINTVVAQGQLLSRALYPRLWEYVQSLTFGREVVSESVRASSINYSGTYTTGDGVSNFRLPDERGTFDRMLDLGRGLDYNRAHAFAGGYEADALKSHDHIFRDYYFVENSETVSTSPNREWTPTNYNGLVGSKNSDRDNNMFLFINHNTYANSPAATENIVKNVAKLNLIKF